MEVEKDRVEEGKRQKERLQTEIAMEEERMFPSVKGSSFRRKLLLAAK